MQLAPLAGDGLGVGFVREGRDLNHAAKTSALSNPAVFERFFGAPVDGGSCHGLRDRKHLACSGESIHGCRRFSSGSRYLAPAAD